MAFERPESAGFSKKPPKIVYTDHRARESKENKSACTLFRYFRQTSFYKNG